MAELKRAGKVFVLNSQSGEIAKVNSPFLLEAASSQAEFYLIAKAVGEGKSIGSRKLREKYGTVLDGVSCATRPFDFYLYAFATTLNTYHARAIRAKVKDIVGRSWRLNGEAPKAIQAALTEFFTNAFGELTFSQGMGNVWTDYESLGNGYLEVVPTVKGEPAELTHIPSTEMWVRLDQLGFVQQKNGLYSHFRLFGAPPEWYADLPASDPLAKGKEATSVIHFSRYFPLSPYYGVPSIMPAWNKLALMVLETEYNLQFFNNNAIPDYAVILDGEWADDAESLISEYFRTHLKGQAHKTLVMQAPNGGKITFEKLTSDNAKEGSFRLLRQDCRDEILQAHGVPPQKVGIVETGRLGGNQGSAQITEYKNSIVEPGQESVATALTKIITTGFEVKGLAFEFDPYDIEDAKLEADIDAIYLDRKVLTPNEVRKDTRPELPPLPGGDEPLSTKGDAGASAEPVLQEMQRDLKKAIRA
jgi:hypothetical protein